MNYNNSFENRVDNYNYAITKYPNVLENEFKTAIQMCDIQSSDILLNILAGGIPLNKYFSIKPRIYKEYELNPKFNIDICSLDNIPEKDNTVDIIITLTSLHHMNNNDREIYYKECFRILKNLSGKLIIGDVIKDSKEAKWLDEFVNKYNSKGHIAQFFTDTDKTLIEKNGFISEVQLKTYPWIFETEEMLVDFCKNLFGLNLATYEQILDGIKLYLEPEYLDNNIIIHWSLIYFISSKNLA
jgi:SAM-dependent methyltransferase